MLFLEYLCGTEKGKPRYINCKFLLLLTVQPKEDVWYMCGLHAK